MARDIEGLLRQQAALVDLRRLMPQMDGSLDVIKDAGTTWTLRFPILSAADTTGTLPTLTSTLRSLEPVLPTDSRS